MTRFYGACATAEVVPFPGVALAKSSGGWGCGIPLFKVREGWAAPVRGGADRQQVPRLRKIIRLADDLSPLGMTRFYGLVPLLKLCPSRAWRFPSPQRDGLWNPTLRTV